MAYPEYVEQPFICSVEGITFIVKFVNEGNQQSPNYTIYSYKVPKTRAIAEQGTDTNNAQDFNIQHFHYEEFECPICQSSDQYVQSNIVRCGVCKQFTCMGASTEIDFKCNEQCGSISSWANTTPLASIEGSEGKANRKLLGSSSGNKQLGYNPAPSTK